MTETFLIVCDVCGTVRLAVDELVVVRRPRLRLMFMHCGGVQTTTTTRRTAGLLRELGVPEVDGRIRRAP